MTNPTIIQAIKDMIPKHSIHIYYDSKDEAQRESFRSGNPWFVSAVGGMVLYSVRCKN